MHVTRPLFIAALAAAAALLTAQAANANPAGVADAGSASIVSNGNTVPLGPVSPCSVTGQQQNHSNGASAPGLVSYGSASSTCTVDTQADTSTSTANGSKFALSALQAYGGPLIKIATYMVKCTANTNGTSASWSFGGLTGVTIPSQIPQNYTVPVQVGNTVLANLIFNEIILPNPNDGSLTLNMLHIVLFPNGTPPNTPTLSGDIYVGSTSCSPTS